jgi:hypothetical protein
MEVGEISIGTKGFRKGGAGALRGSPKLGVLMSISSSPGVVSTHLIILSLAIAGVTRCVKMCIEEWPKRMLSHPKKEFRETETPPDEFKRDEGNRRVEIG